MIRNSPTRLTWPSTARLDAMTALDGPTAGRGSTHLQCRLLRAAKAITPLGHRDRWPSAHRHPRQATAERWAMLDFFFNDTATTEIYTLSLHDALPIASASC